MQSEAVLRADERNLPVFIGEKVEHCVGDLDQSLGGCAGIQALGWLLGDELLTRVRDPGRRPTDRPSTTGIEDPSARATLFGSAGPVEFAQR